MGITTDMLTDLARAKHNAHRAAREREEAAANILRLWRELQDAFPIFDEKTADAVAALVALDEAKIKIRENWDNELIPANTVLEASWWGCIYKVFIDENRVVQIEAREENICD